jgi:hypothetical protein
MTAGRTTTSEGARTVSTHTNHRANDTNRARSDGDALLDAADAIGDMAYRIRLKGPEPNYASEKLGHALYKAAEGLALCDVELEEVAEEARRGHQHGRWLKQDAR